MATFNIAWQNKLLLNKKKINLCQSCSLVFPDVLYPSLDAVPTSCCALCDGLVPAVTRMVKSHHTKPFHQGEVYK